MHVELLNCWIVGIVDFSVDFVMIADFFGVSMISCVFPIFVNFSLNIDAMMVIF
jgi:hypothetical protein